MLSQDLKQKHLAKL